MTRIVSGFAGSLTIAVPSAGTRPTSERVREAIFSALEARDAIAGCRVLDLYAGSGALGLEAASRGAVHVTLVEKGTAAAAACRANAAAVLRAAPKGGTLGVDVAGRSVQQFLTTSLDSWDLVFIDPPYELDAAELVACLEALVPRLAPDALLVVERSSRDAEPAWPAGLALEKRKDYGDTSLYWVHASS
jgi:16S rRNA (guanine966-N2)-methyltransferase